MKNLFIIFGLLLSFNASATILTWVDADQREDNSTFTKGEVGSYTVYYGTISGVYTNSLVISDGTLNSFTTSLFDTGVLYYMVMTTTDTDGRESKYSAEITKGAFQLMAPSTVADFSVTQELGTLNYTFAWLAPSTYDDGITPLPAGAISKFYLFDNGRWVQDIPASQNSLYKTLTIGDHLFEMEAEIVIGCKYVASKRRVMVADVVLITVTPPKHPYDMQFDIPEGYRAVIEILPVN